MNKSLVIADDGSWSYVRDNGTYDVPLTARYVIHEVIEPVYDKDMFDFVLDEVQSLEGVKYTIVPKIAEQQLIVTKKRLTDVVQSHLDQKAQQYGYDSIFTACTYAASTNAKFKNEATLFIAWRDSVWDYCYQFLDDVQNGTREIPSADELLAELPVFGGI